MLIINGSQRKCNVLEGISFIWCYKSVGMNSEQSELKIIRSCVLFGIIWDTMLQYFVPCFEKSAKSYGYWLKVYPVLKKRSAKTSMQANGFQYVLYSNKFLFRFSIIFQFFVSIKRKININIQKPLQYLKLMVNNCFQCDKVY